MSLRLLNNVRDICKRKGVTITDLEKRAGMADNSLFKWAYSSPSIEKVAAVAAELEVTVDDLLAE